MSQIINYLLIYLNFNIQNFELPCSQKRYRLKFICKTHVTKGCMFTPRLGPPYLTSVPQHTPEMKAFIQQLVRLPINPDSILMKIKCNEIGQTIFDHYKQKSNNLSVAGGTALQDILTALPEYCADGWERQRFICSAWSDIGDDIYRWPING